MKKTVALVGSGNFGSALALVFGEQIKKLDAFENEVKMWVYEELVDGRKLTEIINEEHENVKYLKGFKLPENIVAEPDLGKTVLNADLILFCLPHPFLPRTLGSIKKAFEEGKRTKPFHACSMIKGLDFDRSGPKLLSKLIVETLSPLCESCSVMMGANIATDVASKNFVETTLGYSSLTCANLVRPLFDTPSLQVQMVEEVSGVELCGALKNVIAMGCGFVNGLGLGASTFATILRIGLEEMKGFIQIFFPGVNEEIFFLSCGVGDLVCTCSGGRNARMGEAFVKRGLKSSEWGSLEKELLKGQKMAGLQTCKEVYDILQDRGLESKFPLLTTIYKIAYEDEEKGKIVQLRKKKQ